MERQLYPGIAFSPQATITENIGEADTIIKISDVSAFPEAPNLATIGIDEDGETILYTAKTEDALSGCRRGVEGTAKAWKAGEIIGRNFTAKDHNDLIDAINEIGSAATAAQEAATAAGDSVKVAQDAAQTAQEAASAAEGKATAAAETAEQAAKDAAQAKEDSQTAARAAASASSAAGAAQVAVEGATSAANEAKQTAETSIAAAGTAQEKADEARKIVEDIRQRLYGEQLLDNWYWAQKDAIINQRGETSYSGAVYGIDRWKSSGNLTVSIMDKELSVSNKGSSEEAFFERIENGLAFLGETLTLSVLTTEGDLYSCVVNVPQEAPENGALLGETETDFGHLQLYYIEGNLLQFTMAIAVGYTAHLKAAKMELGDVQTLCHQENEKWMLNDPPPNKAAELLKCMRYYQQSWSDKPLSDVKPSNRIVRPACSTYYLQDVTFCVIMRTSPSIRFFTVYNVEGNVSEWSSGTHYAVSAGYKSPNGFVVGNSSATFQIGKYYSFHYAASADL